MHPFHRQDPQDQETLARIFEQYKNLVYRTAYLMLDNACDAEEALQEVFIQVFKSLQAYDPSKGAFTTWLHRITINYCLGVRRRQRSPEQALDGESSGWVDEAAGQRLAGLADRDAVRQAIGELSEKQRAVIILRYYWEIPYAEIAQILDVPLGTVKSRVDLALRTLREKMTGQRETPYRAPTSQEESCP